MARYSDLPLRNSDDDGGGEEDVCLMIFGKRKLRISEWKTERISSFFPKRELTVKLAVLVVVVVIDSPLNGQLTSLSLCLFVCIAPQTLTTALTHLRIDYHPLKRLSLSGGDGPLVLGIAVWIVYPPIFFLNGATLHWACTCIDQSVWSVRS